MLFIHFYAQIYKTSFQLQIHNQFIDSIYQYFLGMLAKGSNYRYESQFMKLGELSKILYTLRKQRINTVRLSISCSDKSIISYLERNLLNEPGIHLGRTKFKSDLRVLGKQGVPIEIVKGMKYTKTIDLCNKPMSRIFINEYRTKLRELGEEFHLFMIWESTIIRVYSETPISSVFQSQIIGLKQKLKWIIYQNERFYSRLKMSKFIASKLHQMNIRYLFMGDKKSIILHSSDVPADFLKAGAIAFDYDAVILKFSNPSFTPMVNRTYFKLLMFQLGEKLEQIQQNYEIKCQVNEKKMGLLMHTRDPIFSKQPIRQLNNLMSKIMFVTYWTKNPREHLFHIRNNRPKSKCLKVMMSETFIYTSWNLNNKIQPLQVTKVYEKLLSECGLYTIVRVIFKYGELNESLIKDVEELAQKYKLHSFPPQFQDERQQIIHIKFKSFNQQKRDSKIIQLNSFLQELISKNTNQQIKIPEKYIQIQQNQETQNIQVQPNNQQQQQEVKDILINRQVTNYQRNKYFEYYYQPPLIKRAQKFSATSGKRNRQLEDYIFSNVGIICRIWDIVFELNYKEFDQPVQGQICKICVTSSFQTDSGIFIKKPKEVNFSNLQQGTDYYLVYKIQSSSQYILGFKMKVYNR